MNSLMNDVIFVREEEFVRKIQIKCLPGADSATWCSDFSWIDMRKWANKLGLLTPSRRKRKHVSPNADDAGPSFVSADDTGSQTLAQSTYRTSLLQSAVCKCARNACRLFCYRIADLYIVHQNFEYAKWNSLEFGGKME
ncbi:hypothetical protein L1987_12443 [Smallanthus sonchifolius]|uniref:Uncharacterized protein n=1 Tax=Smallanthus sonchifolius TaxID=185202 RepID=A0ACB9JG39_9ASTR|nr:hypothetical protein L1987_12443 [Smallanthus sonchifolius]